MLDREPTFPLVTAQYIVHDYQHLPGNLNQIEFTSMIEVLRVVQSIGQ